MVDAREWLIRKDGYYYRPNCSGYTTSKFEAGRYTKAEAEREAAVEPWHMKAIHQDDVEDDPVSSRVRMDSARIAELEAENKRLTNRVDDLKAGYDSLFQDFKYWRDKALSRTGAVKDAAIAGWNACRKSVYAVCEDVDAEVDRLKSNPLKGGTPEQQIHAEGCFAGQRRAAKSIARGFGAMNAEGDDKLIAALAALEPAAPEGQQPVAWLYDWIDDDGETQTEASTSKITSVNFKPVSNVRPLYTRPSEQAVTEAAGPFFTFANHAIEKIDDGWVWRTSSTERICDWFGPSDFGDLKAAMEAGG